MSALVFLRGLSPQFVLASTLAVASMLLVIPGQDVPREGPRPERPAKRLAARSTEGALTLYVSPNGKPEASGAWEDPLDLQSVLARAASVPPGSIIWLLGGTYGDGTKYFLSRFEGTPEAPIILRQVPGERATINGWLIIEGAHTWFWGFEVMTASEDRTGERAKPNTDAVDGVFVNGPYTKLINLIIHDTRDGVGVWTPAEGAEVHDCIIYNNGWQGPDRGHGHGIYTQNRDAVKRLTGNIIFNQFGVGIHAYGSDKAFVRNYLVDHNAVFNNGVLAIDGRTDNLFFGSGGSLSGIRVEENYTYHTPAADIGVSRIGWQFGPVNQDVAVLGNYFIGGYIALEMHNWTSANVQGNVTYSERSYNVNLQPPADGVEQVMDWDRNRHHGSTKFLLRGRGQSADGWRGAGLDRSGELSAGRPAGTWSFVRPHTYDSGRANIVIYNWDLKETVCVDVSSVMLAGTTYKVYDAQNIFGPPVASGTLENTEVCIPMKELKVALPIGTVPNPPVHTAPEFGVFVLVQE